MNKFIVVALFQEHDKQCWYKEFLKFVKNEKLCTLCSQANRDISILLSRLDGARKDIDIGIALPNRSNLNEYLPYEKANFKLFARTGVNLNERILNILDRSINMGYEYIILLSHSTPDIPPIYIKKAILKLQEGTELILGPLSNGGLYLIGMSYKFYKRIKDTNLINKVNFQTNRLSLTLSFFKIRYKFSIYFLPKWHQLKRKNDFKKLIYKQYKQNIAWNAVWTRQIIKKYMKP